MGNENENKVTKESKKKESKNQGSKYQGTKEPRKRKQRIKETHSNHRIKEFKTEEKNKNNTALAKGRWQTTYYCCVEGCCTYNN